MQSRHTIPWSRSQGKDVRTGTPLPVQESPERSLEVRNLFSWQALAVAICFAGAVIIVIALRSYLEKPPLYAPLVIIAVSAIAGYTAMVWHVTQPNDESHRNGA